ncbi:MAG: hypothetical protein ACD_25C00084G0001 [uncultured bacterium]|nr:hypothetical protein P147_WWE3C00001G0743 [candidate division WWE3 bacterium RAAC2_WWE3_1]EKD95052.1 MAG: hypothetical protein ACD_25C00084G0001 [uncultured bacterium]KKS29192.1 MAG: hypothetical protein UU91_C0008G0056 [candidate division WWE3 bacterium GW2011_GWB1_42_117]KKS54742.1 MAG: hypothetical protein UV21_C0005G0106 [candidate division WWE3 bacterium GW2011_GWD2_42_34]KKT04498.1 MAG: hypothetical protein UV83_C0012G0018 [candidate division WWE3 bacterium GW2011_GWE2_43_18]KKT06167.
MKKLGLMVFLILAILSFDFATYKTSAPRIAKSEFAATKDLEVLGNTPVLQEIIATKQPLTTATPTPLPKEEVNPYIFRAADGNIDLSIGPVVMQFDGGGFEGIEISAELISPVNLGGYASTSEGLEVGNGIGVSRAENYGNILIGIHSGYHKDEPLEAEPFRFYFERRGKTSEESVLKKLQQAVGSRGKLYSSGTKVEVEVVAAIRMDHNAAEEIRLNPEQVLDIVTDGRYESIGNAEAFETVKNNGHEIMINFCGWGPNLEPTYYRYVILLNVLEASYTPLHIN